MGEWGYGVEAVFGAEGACLQQPVLVVRVIAAAVDVVRVHHLRAFPCRSRDRVAALGALATH